MPGLWELIPPLSAKENCTNPEAPNYFSDKKKTHVWDKNGLAVVNI